MVRAGWVYGWGIPGWVQGRAIPGTQPPWKAEPWTAKRAPEAPARGLEWVVQGAAPARAPGTTTPGPCRALRARFAVPGPLPASWPIRRDSTSIPIKLVKTTKCHRKASKRPPVVPNSQNGSQKSPLEILGFPFSLAFSHKELMGRI